MNHLAKRAFNEGFTRRQSQLASGLVKSAIPSRAGMFIDPARAAFVESLGRDLAQKVKTDRGLWSGLRASMLGGYEGYDRVNWTQRNFVDQMRMLQKKLRVERVGGSPSAISALEAEVAKAKNVFNTNSARLYQEIGTTAEGRMPMLDTALPVAGAAGLTGVGAYGVGSIRGQRDQKLDDAQHLAQMPLMERLKHVFAPQSVALSQLNRPNTSQPQQPTRQ